MNQPYFVSGCHPVTPLWQWILQIEYTECKTVGSSFALCPHIHYIQVPHCCFYYFQRLIFFGTLGWVLSEPCDLLYLSYRKYSMGFTVVTGSSLLFAYLLAKAITHQNVWESLFSLLKPFGYVSHWQCFIPARLYNHRILHNSFFCCPPVYSQHLLGWVRFAPAYAVSERFFDNCFIIINLFTSSQYTKHIVKNILYKHSSFFLGKFFRISAF